MVLANRYHTLDLSHLKVRYEIVQNGEMLAKGSYPAFYTAPGTTETLPLPLPELPAKLHGEAYVNYYVELAQDAFYAPAEQNYTAVRFRLLQVFIWQMRK